MKAIYEKPYVGGSSELLCLAGPPADSSVQLNQIKELANKTLKNFNNLKMQPAPVAPRPGSQPAPSESSIQNSDEDASNFTLPPLSKDGQTHSILQLRQKNLAISCAIT